MKPILFNTKMTKAILDGRKTRTKEVIKLDFEADSINIINTKAGGVSEVEFENFDSDDFKIVKPNYQIGDVLWIREPARIEMCFIEEIHFMYLADGKTSKMKIPERFIKDGFIVDWMARCQGIPNGCIKEMARIFLKITNVRAERLQDITQKDIYYEGIEQKTYMIDHVDGYAYRSDLKDYAYQEFMKLWNSTAPKGYKWEDNPYVFVYEFERVER